MPPNGGTYAIHIMFDRQSAKSGDCYIEFPTATDAAHVFSSRKNFYDRHSHDPQRVIGGRRVRIKMSSQEELMQEIFPKAKCVTWRKQQPIILPPVDEYTSGFNGFLSSEELVFTSKWALEPRKSKYTGTHPQRPYESIITLLFKVHHLGPFLQIFLTLFAVPLVRNLKLHPHPTRPNPQYVCQDAPRFDRSSLSP